MALTRDSHKIDSYSAATTSVILTFLQNIKKKYLQIHLSF